MELSQDNAEFISSFLKSRGVPHYGLEIKLMRGDGSQRLFWRVTSPATESSFVAMTNPPRDDYLRKENFAYLQIGKHLRARGTPVPEIFRFDLQQGWFILEDMGSESLQDLAAYSDDPVFMYEKVLEQLFRLQIEGVRDFDSRWCCQTEKYDLVVMRKYESDYFKEAFLSGYLGLKSEWPELDRPFQYLAETASKADSSFLLHRDFQSRNIMIKHGKVGIVDWQGSRLGPLGYDLASLLIDPYTDLSPVIRSGLFESYLALLREYNPGWIDPFVWFFPYLAIQRNLQILGAFGFLTKVRGKRYFAAYVPRALRSLSGLLAQLNDSKLGPLEETVNTIRPSY